ncbi:MAG: tRNA (N(6)-L-threonylcarbamoyladenosine(37)-C(2))-methylthiotransferase MtaB [Alphaproteobacteria bacterium]|nr:tRNA (N(6)-L-threonylcarbamoyladenosine(37)-C(2))-methylthiotransferase MtaB [Alphaproteobacteria bacterium]
MSAEILTFGCRLNAVESEIMRGHAAAAGLTDAVIVNTCAVTSEAVRQARQAIRKARRERPNADIIVTGCAVQTDPGLFAAMPEVTRLLGNAEKRNAESFARGGAPIVISDIMELRETASHLIDGLADRARTFVEVQNGCDHRCTFCIIPFGRGPSRSVPAGIVIDQVKRLVDRGINEVVLTGVDLTAYGADLPGAPSLGSLVQRIVKLVPDLPRLRLSSIDGAEADRALIEAIVGEPRVMPHVHLSLQAGDDMILKRMKRRHTRADAHRLVERLRARRPEIAFGADLIAGFPTETDEMAENTREMVDALGLAFVHVFPFSPRPGTPAARMPQLEGRTIKARAKRLRETAEDALARHLTRQIGRTLTLLVEQETSARAPDFSPVTLTAPAAPGTLLAARITDALPRSLIAEAA